MIILLKDDQYSALLGGENMLLKMLTIKLIMGSHGLCGIHSHNSISYP